MKEEPKQELPILNGSYGCTIETNKQETIKIACVQCCGTGEIQKSTNRKQSNFECDLCNGKGHWNKLIEPKQETLEEVAEKILIDYGIKYKGEKLNVSEVKKLMVNMAKWQQERSYSEEEIMNALHSVELKYNRDFTKIYEGVLEYLKELKNK